MKKLVLKGSARERGLVHGKTMRDEIHQALSYYRSRFLRNRSSLQKHVDLLMRQVESFRPDYIQEMDAIAEASGVEPFWIYSINARSELMSSPMECSSVAFPQQGLMGQNWDWAAALSDLLVVADIELENGHRFLTMTEPGMLAKIGINDKGLGVCLNILPANQQLTGLPVHILLRALLESDDLESAEKLVNSHGAGKASHITVGSAENGAFAVELAPEQPYIFALEDHYYLHTNHYLQPDQAKPSATKACTESRLTQMAKLVKQSDNLNVDKMQQVLNSAEEPYPVLRPYRVNELTGLGGTLVTALMDLHKKELHLREGFDAGNPFTVYGFD